MIVTHPSFCAPVLCIDDFLSDDEADRVLRECIDLKKIHMPARIFDGPTASKIDKDYRENEVVYLDEMFRSAPERSDILSILRRRIWTEECKRLWNERYHLFDIINYSTWQETVVSRYGDNAFYARLLRQSGARKV